MPEYWAGDIYHDADKAFYKAFGQGDLRTASSLALLNPLNPAWGRILAARCVCVQQCACAGKLLKLMVGS